MLRDVLLVAHIAAVSAWLGANIVQFVLTPWFARRPVEQNLGWVSATLFLGRRFYNVAGMLIAFTGVSLVLETDYNFSSRFVMVGIATIVVGAVLGVAVFDRLMNRHVEALQSSDLALAARLRARTLQVAVIDTSLVLTTIFVMVKRWHP
jgi:hypothetical protein